MLTYVIFMGLFPCLLIKCDDIIDAVIIIILTIPRNVCL